MRKGELSSTTIDRDWPHQVTLPASRCTGEQHVRIRAFCADLSLAPRGYTYVEGGGYHNVYCFAVIEHAQAFADEFAGRMLETKDRPRWPGRKRRR